MKFTVQKNNDGVEQLSQFNVDDSQSRLTVLDALISARDDDSSLAFRYGCRNRLCGVCTVKVNGKPRLACRTPAREDMHVEAAPGLPVLQDLVVRRDGLNRQLSGKLPTPNLDQAARVKNHDAYDSLGRCIECYACLDGCPLHAKNTSDTDQETTLEFANPYSFLRVQRNLCHPAISQEQARDSVKLALNMGLDSCLDCKRCTCGVGIDLIKEVIEPLLDHAEQLQHD